MYQLRPVIPGETLTINQREAHCLLEPFGRLAVRYEKDSSFNHWHNTIKDQAGRPDTITGAAPTSEDRTFFELLVKNELVLFSVYEQALAASEEQEEKIPYLTCGCRTGEHERILAAWLEREIEFPKKFAASRRALETLPAHERIFGRRFLSPEDARRIIHEDIENRRAFLITGDMAILDELDSMYEKVACGEPVSGFSDQGFVRKCFEGYDRKERARSLAAAHERTLADAKRELEKIIEKYVIPAQERTPIE